MSELENALKTKSILVVDDHKFLRGIMADMLRTYGAQHVHMADNGIEGMKQFKTWMPDIVITDLNMDPMNGLEFTKWIRQGKDSPNPEVPIIMLTGNNDQVSIMAARDAGVNELIIKPVVPESVYRRLHTVLFEQRRFVRTPEYVGPCRRRRRNPNYNGDMRRITDPIKIKEISEENQELINEIHTEAEALMAVAKTLDVGNRRQVQRVYDRTEETRELAIQAEDESLEGAAASLSGYIEAMGASGNMDRKVIQMHLEAIMSLVHLKDIGDGKRAAVVRGLQQLVHKRMHNVRAS